MERPNNRPASRLAPAPEAASLPLDALRWRCEPNTLSLRSTADAEPICNVIGQSAAVEALRFGLAIDAPGQNIFVRGLTGTGRATLVRCLLAETRPRCPQARDLCYVHNFVEPDRPRLISLARGKGRLFRSRLDNLANFVRDELHIALKSQELVMRRTALEQGAQARIDRHLEPFKKSVMEVGPSVASLQVGPVEQAALLPVVDGKAIAPEEWEHLRASGKVTEEEATRLRKQHDEFLPRLQEVMRQVNEIHRELAEKAQSLFETAARAVLQQFVQEISAEFPESSVRTFLAEVLEDVATSHHRDPRTDADGIRQYRVNHFLCRTVDDSCPVIIEDTPTVPNLLGTVDQRTVTPPQPPKSVASSVC